MDPVTIAIVCIATFGVAMGLAAFIRGMLLSRDKKLNDAAQTRALNQEAVELEKMRNQMANAGRFGMHYKLLEENKEQIEILNLKIDNLIQKKADLIQRYANSVRKESLALINNEEQCAGKSVCDALIKETDNELAIYNREIEELHQQRIKLREDHSNLQHQLLAEEKSRNERLDQLYQQHTTVLEKVYIRHNENSENITKESINATTQTFKDLFTIPLQYIINFFSGSIAINPQQLAKESVERQAILNMENKLNDLSTLKSFLPENKASLNKNRSDFSMGID